MNVSTLTNSSTTDYVGNIIYENNVLKRILVDGGYIEGDNYYFYVNDHLGNNRVVTNAAASVVQSTQYYPFGSSFADATGGSVQPYKYNGKELDGRNGLNWYDYGMRYLALDIPVTPTLDPRAEKYCGWSPYAYVMNNPMKYIDPRGDTARVYIETVDYGHAWMSVGEGKDMVVYTYALNSEDNVWGDGEFSKFSGKAAQKYLDSKKNTNYSTYAITDVTDEAVAKVADNLLGSSNKIVSKESGYSFMTDKFEIKVPDGGTPKGIGVGDKNLKLGEVSQGGRYSYDIRNVGTYNPFSNNCGTVVSELFYMAGSATFTKPATFGGGTAPVRYITPNALKKYLDNK